MAIEHTAALFYSWSIHYIVNRASVTSAITESYSADSEWIASNCGRSVIAFGAIGVNCKAL